MNTKNLSTGVLLINVGTPDSPTPKSVRRYLKEFLWDKRIIDIFWLFRIFLLYCIILPLRAKSSSKLYQNIWTQNGSPLLVLSEKCRFKLAKQLGESYTVQIGMGYGNPSIKNSIDYLLKKNINHLIIVPMFPQYATSTTGSVIENTSKYLNTKWHIPTYSFVKPFFKNRHYINAFKELIQANQVAIKPDFILFSYHGLPVRHLKKSANEHKDSICLTKKHCCDVLNAENHFCYRAQCFETTRLIAHACELRADQFAISFQSRFGRAEWILPDTQKILIDLYEKGVRTLSVVCPGFVVDCLETLEEIEIRLKEEWIELGGTDLVLIKSLNDNDSWILCLEELIKENNRTNEI